MNEVIRVCGWEDFQHYKKPKPVWIKLYRDLLSNYTFSRLDPEQRWTLIGLWLLAAETGNEIPNDEHWLKHRLNIVSKPDLDILETLGFITFTEPSINGLDLLYSQTEEETETEERKRQKKTNGLLFEEFWGVYPRRLGSNPKKLAAKSWETAIKKIQPDRLLEKTRQFAEQMDREGTVGTKFIPQAATWLNQERWGDDPDLGCGSDNPQPVLLNWNPPE